MAPSIAGLLFLCRENIRGPKIFFHFVNIQAMRRRQITKEWLDVEEVYTIYEKTCLSCLIGIKYINPQRIIALSRPYKEIYDDHDMRQLNARIQNEGWRDKDPEGIDVYRTPNGAFFINNGGNHRAILSNELGIKCIQAQVTVLVPYKDIAAGVLDPLQVVISQRDTLFINRTYHQLSKSECKLSDRLQQEIDSLETEIGIAYLTQVNDDLIQDEWPIGGYE